MVNHIRGLKKCRLFRRRVLTIQMFSTCNIPVSFQTMAASRLCNQPACHPDAPASVRGDTWNIRMASVRWLWMFLLYCREWRLLWLHAGSLWCASCACPRRIFGCSVLRHCYPMGWLDHPEMLAGMVPDLTHNWLHHKADRFYPAV